MTEITFEQLIASFTTGFAAILGIIALFCGGLWVHEKLTEGPWPTWVYGGWELGKKVFAVVFVIFMAFVLAIGCVGLGMDILGIPHVK